MAEPPAEAPKESGKPPEAVPSPSALPAETEKVLAALAQNPTLLSVVAGFFSKTSFGPDPETAKILAQSEMHGEDLRLQAYRAMLDSKDKQSGRDHEFRVRQLNRELCMNLVVLIAALAGVGVGLYLTTSGKTQVGSNILIASAGLLVFLVGGKSPFLHAK